MSRNPNVKKSNEVISYTLEELRELRKCTKDPIHFVTKYCKIQHPVHGEIPFDLRPYQQRMITGYAENRLCITLTPRQCGKCVVGETLVTVREPTILLKFLRKLVKLVDLMVNTCYR